MAISFCVVAEKGGEALPAGLVRCNATVRVPSPRPDRFSPSTRVEAALITPLPLTWPPPEEVMVQVKAAPASPPVITGVALVTTSTSLPLNRLSNGL